MLKLKSSHQKKKISCIILNLIEWRGWQLDQVIKDRKVLFCFFRATLMAYGISRLGIESELQIPAYTTAGATPDPSCIFNLYHSSQS